MGSRFKIIGILTVLAVLASLLSVVPIRAQTAGTIVITGGLDGKFFSDKSTPTTNWNIVTATVTDVDLSPPKTGKARFVLTGAHGSSAAGTAGISAPFDLTDIDNSEVTDTDGAGPVTDSAGAAIIEGETSVTEDLQVIDGATYTANGGPGADLNKGKCDGSTTPNTTCTLSNRFGDADGDGVYEPVAPIQGSTGDITFNFGPTGSGQPGTISSVNVGADAVNSNPVITLNNTSALDTLTGNIVRVTYETYEYDILNPGNTPVTLTGTTVEFGDDFVAPFSQKTIDTINNTNGTIFTTSDVTGDASNDSVVITFRYDRLQNIPGLVTYSTPSAGSKGLTRQLSGIETNAASGIFQTRVALFSLADFNTIEGQATGTIGDLLTDPDLSADLQTRLTRARDALDDIYTTGLTNGDQATNLLALLVPVSDGEVLTVSYLDANPIATRSATADIDLKAPTITAVQPAHDTFSNTQAQTFVVRVTDEPSAGGKQAGLDQSAVEDQLFINGAQQNTTAPLLIGTDSFQLSYPISLGVTGVVQWWMQTQDKVGNAPASTVLGTSGNPFEVIIDTAAPSLAPDAQERPVHTGGKLDKRLETPVTGTVTTADVGTLLTDANADFIAAGVQVGDRVTNITDGSTGIITAVNSATQLAIGADLTGGTENDFDLNDAYRIENPELNKVTLDTTARRFVSVYFDIGANGAPIDPATVQASDFRVGGATPVNATVGTAVGNLQGVLLELSADQATNATPGVELVGSVLDRAGNPIATFTGTSAKTAKDRLAPAVTATITAQASSRPVGNTTVTIDFTSGETAAGVPTVTINQVVRDAANETMGLGAAVNATVTTTGVNSWRATVLPTSPGLFNVQVSVTDASGNAGTAGVTDPDGTGPAGTIVSGALLFEFDNRLNDGAPLVNLTIGATSGSGFVLSPNTGTQAEPATDLTSPFVTIHVDTEGSEYQILADLDGDTQVDDPIPNVDTHNTVTLTSAMWTMPDGTQVNILSQLQKVDDNSFVYAATNLPLGTHRIAVQARDAVGNVSTIPGSTTPTTFTFQFDVVERGKYSLTLQPGTNFISLPGTPANPSINAVIPANAPINLVATYDPTSTTPWLIATRNPQTGLFEGPLSTITAERGYVVQATSFYTLEVLIPRAGFQQLPPSIPVFGGQWNLVPVVSAKDATDPSVQPGQTVDSDVYFGGLSVAAVFTFDTAQAQFVKVVPDGSKTDNATTDDLVFGRSYWVRPVNDGTIIP